MGATGSRLRRWRRRPGWPACVRLPRSCSMRGREGNRCSTANATCQEGYRRGAHLRDRHWLCSGSRCCRPLLPGAASSTMYMSDICKNSALSSARYGSSAGLAAAAAAATMAGKWAAATATESRERSEVLMSRWWRRLGRRALDLGVGRSLKVLRGLLGAAQCCVSDHEEVPASGGPRTSLSAPPHHRRRRSAAQHPEIGRRG